MQVIMSDSKMQAHYNVLMKKYPLIVGDAVIWYKMDQAIMRINALDDDKQFKIKRKLMMMEPKAKDWPLLRQFVTYLQEYIGTDVATMHLHQ